MKEWIAMDVRPITEHDWPTVRAIYDEGIATRNATFITSSPEWPEWDSGHLPTCRLVATADGQVLGWAALSPVSSRCVYAGVAEVSVYVAASAQGRGIGRTLLSALVEACGGTCSCSNAVRHRSLEDRSRRDYDHRACTHIGFAGV